MAKKKEITEIKEVVEITEPKEEVKSKNGKFVVLDSNGKPVRDADTEEEAKELAKVYHGRVK